MHADCLTHWWRAGARESGKGSRVHRWVRACTANQRPLFTMDLTKLQSRLTTATSFFSYAIKSCVQRSQCTYRRANSACGILSVAGTCGRIQTKSPFRPSAQQSFLSTPRRRYPCTDAAAFPARQFNANHSVCRSLRRRARRSCPRARTGSSPVIHASARLTVSSPALLSA